MDQGGPPLQDAQSARLAALIDAALPQTQCTRCGYPDCAAYAQAISIGEAAINRCPPGGEEGIARLSRITGQAALLLDPACGLEGSRRVAVIDEAWCIGCTLCLDVCPTDAILGRNKRMHTVIAVHCTGCELCIPVCPVDCIELVDASAGRTGWDAWSDTQAHEALRRYRLHSDRRAPVAAPCTAGDMEKAPLTADVRAPQPAPDQIPAAPVDRKRAVIEAALARARARRA